MGAREKFLIIFYGFAVPERWKTKSKSKLHLLKEPESSFRRVIIASVSFVGNNAEHTQTGATYASMTQRGSCAWPPRQLQPQRTFLVVGLVAPWQTQRLSGCRASRPLRSENHTSVHSVPPRSTHRNSCVPRKTRVCFDTPSRIRSAIQLVSFIPVAKWVSTFTRRIVLNSEKNKWHLVQVSCDLQVHVKVNRMDTRYVPSSRLSAHPA